MRTVPTQDLDVAAPIVTSNNTAKPSLLKRAYAGLFEPVDIAFLVYFRILFNAILVWEVYRYFTHGWIKRYYVEPIITFSYFGFSWIKPWPGNGMYIHFALLGVAAVFAMTGFLYRLAAPVVFLGFTYWFLLDQTRYLNHFYLVSLICFLMCFLPAERAFSVDALLRRKIRSDVVPAWTLWLLRVQVGIPFFFGGIAKINSDWLQGGEPMRIWLHPFVKTPALGHLFEANWVVYSFVFNGLVLDLFVIPLLLWRRSRPFAFAAAVAFNLINALIFQIGIFPWLMLGALLIFFPPDLLRRAARAFTAPEEDLTPPHLTSPYWKISKNDGTPSLSTTQKLVGGVLAAYLLMQLLMPLRHYLYPGNVSWTEEGHNFSWHMKLRTKVGEAVFTVTHPQTGQTWTIKPQDHLESHQVMKMITKPELLLHFSHYLAELKRREGYDDVEVRARVMVSLNGRQPQLLIDPSVDLAKETMNMLPTRWIMPLTTPLGTNGPSILGNQDDDPD